MRDGNESYRLQRSNQALRGDMGDRVGFNGARNGVVSRVVRSVEGIGGKGQPVASIPGALAAVSNRVSNGQYVRGKGDNYNHNHIEEVNHSNNGQHEFPVITGRWLKPANR